MHADYCRSRVTRMDSTTLRPCMRGASSADFYQRRRISSEGMCRVLGAARHPEMPALLVGISQKPQGGHSSHGVLTKRHVPPAAVAQHGCWTLRPPATQARLHRTPASSHHAHIRKH